MTVLPPAGSRLPLSSGRPGVLPAVLVGMMAIITLGCAAEAPMPPVEPAWDGDVTTEGDVTTVVNRAGSVWGKVELVEEASIGELTGDDPYVFSQVRALTATDDRIYVVDRLAAIVRAYDMSGRHLFDIGRPGDGPGEFRNPWAIGVSRVPRVMVRDVAQARLHEFSLDGELLGDWRAAGGVHTTIAEEGFIYVYNRLPAEEGVPARFGMFEVGPDGVGDAIVFPVFETQRTFVMTNRRFLEVGSIEAINQGLDFNTADVPFAPVPVWTVGGDGTLIWGESDAYRFRLERRDGTIVDVEHAEPPVAVDPDEAAWYRERLTRFWRGVMPEFVWGDAEVPAFKRAFTALVSDRDGRVWVVRELAGEPLDGCDPDPDDLSGFLSDPCWYQPYALDGFDEDGRFLGRVVLPPGTRVDAPPFIDGDTMIVVAEDTAGAIMVKRYRIERSR